MPRREVKVTEETAGLRLDRFVVKMWPDFSRSYWQRLIASGNITVNKRREKSGYIVLPGQVIVAEVPDEIPFSLPTATAEGREMPTWVVYCDNAVIVVNKPRDLVVHPSAGHWHDSVVHRLAPWLPHEDGGMRPGVVHRLDRDTSGLLILARMPQAAEKLSQAISDRRVTRQYLAVIKGRLSSPEGIIDAPLARDPKNRLRMAVVYGGREARTHFRTLATWNQVSLVQCTLDTGRTHQIRVHLASLGHPVAGDKMYGGEIPGVAAGQLLHAGHLAFQHPVTEKNLTFTVAPPEDWSVVSRWGDATILSEVVYSDPVPLRTPELLRQLVSAEDRRLDC